MIVKREPSREIPEVPVKNKADISGSLMEDRKGRPETLAQKKAILKKKIEDAETIAISGHTNPDGDCIGSCLGLYTYLVEQYPEKTVDLYLEPIAPKFSFLKYADRIRQRGKKIKYDVFFSLDCSEPERLRYYQSFFEEAKYQVCVDHHFTNKGFGDLRFIEPEASSTCEILFGLFDYEKISQDCAQCLYVGIVHDTGVFKHTNTTRKVMETAGALLEKGIHSENLIDRTFFHKTYAQNQILGQALVKSILLLSGKVIFSVITKKDMEFYEVDSADLDGIIDQLRVTEGVECAILLYEKEEGTYKVSMRANDKVDVSAIAQMFGGGGHIKAAGCTVRGESRDIVMNITQMAEQQLKEQEEKQRESVYDKWNS